MRIAENEHARPLHNSPLIGDDVPLLLLTGDDMRKGPVIDSLDEASIRKLGGERLKKARQAKGLRLRDVFEADPVMSVSRLSGYEQGTRTMPIHIARRLGKMLGVSAAWLLCVDDTMGMTADQIDVIARYSSATPQVQELVLQMLRISPPNA